MKKYYANIHKEWANGWYDFYYIVYGKNPYGIKGGSCGSWIDGKKVSSSTVTNKAPQWMVRACEELERLQLDPESVEVIHEYGSRDYKIQVKEVEEVA